MVCQSGGGCGESGTVVGESRGFLLESLGFLGATVGHVGVMEALLHRLQGGGEFSQGGGGLGHFGLLGKAFGSGEEFNGILTDSEFTEGLRGGAGPVVGGFGDIAVDAGAGDLLEEFGAVVGVGFEEGRELALGEHNRAEEALKS